MPPLLIPSPVLIDQSFPRDEHQLHLVAAALGELIAVLERNEANVLLTATLREVVEAFDWAKPRTLVYEIYRSLAQLFLQPNNRIVTVDISDVTIYEQHPVPVGTERDEMIDFWSDETGKLLVLHDKCTRGEEFFIGVASEYGFGGEPIRGYNNPSRARTFPLLGSDGIGSLSDAYESEIPDNLHLQTISFAAAKKNVGVLGATRIDKPAGGSHYMVRFQGKRSWPLDRNVDPQPDRFLKELEEISGYPFPVIKTALVTGQLPAMKLKFAGIAKCSSA